MKLLKLYDLIAGSKTDFTSQFKNNDALYKQANSFWNQLEGSSAIIVLMFVVLGIAWAATYYKPYNNKPGRHYTPKHWLLFLALTFVSTLLLTFGFEYFAAHPSLNGAMLLELKIAIGNALYASLLYFVTSFVWCNWFPTNAYRWFKL